jgi:hypothetical protein
MEDEMEKESELPQSESPLETQLPEAVPARQIEQEGRRLWKQFLPQNESEGGPSDVKK